MAQMYCKVVNGEIVARELKDGPETKRDIDGNPIWRPYVPMDRPKYDPATHHPPVLTVHVNPSNVAEVWAAPVQKTARELDDDATAKATKRLDDYQTKLIKKLLVSTFMLTNEVRALKSQAPLTANQFIDGLAGLQDPPANKIIELLKAIG